MRLGACLSSVLLCAALLSGESLIASAAPPPPQTSSQAYAALQQATQDELQIQWSDGVGSTPTFISGKIPATGQAPEEIARNFLSGYGTLYGISDQSTELLLQDVTPDDLDVQHVRMVQAVNGVPVFGGQMNLHIKGATIIAVDGSFFPDVHPSTTPQITEDAALAIVRDVLGDADATLRANDSGLFVYVDEGQPHLTWKVNAFSWRNLGNWLVFVDAIDGKIVHKVNQLDTAKTLRVYTAYNGTTLPGTYLCGTPSGCGGYDADAQSAYNNASKVYDYYLNTFGRHSYDNLDSPLVSVVHFDSGYENAFWNGEEMVYGDGDTYAQAFDVVAHELTHGVTEYTSNLIYEHQPGALNESWSDVMAVFAGCSASTGTADCDWTMGETLNSGAGRDLSNPPLYNQPDHMSGYRWLPLESDSGGVHINSGIPNKAAYLLTAGGTFHSINVAGIGYTKAEQIYYRAARYYLTTYAGFSAARGALYTACTDLIGTYGITAANCSSVLNAWAAVGIGGTSSNPHPSKAYIPMVKAPAQSCTPSSLLSNTGFENNLTSWTSYVGTPQINTTYYWSGSKSALLGNGNNKNDGLRQGFNVPAKAQYMQLTLYVGVASSDSTVSYYDKLYFQMLDSNNHAITPDYWLLDNTNAYGSATTPYWWKITVTYNEIITRDLKVQFHGTTDISYPTSFYLDDVILLTSCSRITSFDAAQDTQQPIVIDVAPMDEPPAQIPAQDYIKP